MNKERREKLQEAMVLVGDAKAIIEEVHEQEEEAFESLPENLQSSVNGDVMQEAVNALDDAIAACEEIDDKLMDASA
tara:strand:+ start:857 stop:1087 length:231 start_codon:yes stop_codon:yes gene_type:complete